MPVWHEKTKALIESRELAVVGITQEQHPDRCALFAQWQQFGFPILWDPFGVTGLEVVPVVTAIDEHGIVRLGRPDPRKFDQQFIPEFMDVSFEAVGAEVKRPAGFRISDAEKGQGVALAMARLLRSGPLAQTINADVRTLDEDAASSADPRADFFAGVAHRLRSDGPHAQPGDFQAAADAWHRALNAMPNQYIWRRRIQQWGPRLDKPYAFYDWVSRAIEGVAARGETAVRVLTPLSGSEIADKSREVPSADQKEAVAPDPTGKVERDEGQLVRIHTAAVLHTGGAGTKPRTPRGATRVHVALEPMPAAGPNGTGGAKWALDAEPPAVWIELPEGWRAEATLHSFEYAAMVKVAGSGESLGESEAKASDAAEQALLRIDFGVSTPPVPLVPPRDGPEEGPPPATADIRGYAVYFVCLEDGTCVYRRQDFSVTIDLPEAPAPPDGDPAGESSKEETAGSGKSGHGKQGDH